MGSSHSNSVSSIARAAGFLAQQGSEDGTGSDEPAQPPDDRSYEEYRRVFGILWQAFRAAGLDKALEPEVVHHILLQAGRIPEKTFSMDVGNLHTSVAESRRNHTYQSDQNVLYASLPIERRCSIQRLTVQVSSRDQVRATYRFIISRFGFAEGLMCVQQLPCLQL